jgi:flagellin
MTKSIDNGNQALSMLQTAEGGIDQISNILTRLKEIATQSASDNTTDRVALDTERSNLEVEIGKIALNTRYGTTNLLQGSTTSGTYTGSLTAAAGFQAFDVSGSTATTGTVTLTSANIAAGAATLTLNVGGNTQTVTVSGLTGVGTSGVANFTNFGIKVTVNSALVQGSGNFTLTNGSSNFTYQVGDTNLVENQISAGILSYSTNGSVLALSGDISSKANAQAYMDKIDAAVGNLTTERGKLGAAMNQISYHVANLSTMSENIDSSISTIKDADFAKEMATFTKAQILQQSGVAMLAQANSIPQQVLSLLKG